MTDAPAPAPASMTVAQAFQQALAHAQAGQVPQAQRLYQAILQARPGHAQALSQLGILAMGQGQWDTALRYFDQALALEPDNHDLMGNRFTVLHWQGQHALAEAQARRMLQVAPGSLGAHLALAGELTAQKRYAEAHATLAQMPQPATLHAQDLRRLAFTHSNLLGAEQRWHEAALWMRRLLQAMPQDRQALQVLASCLLSQGQASEALAVVLQCLDLAEDDEARRLFIACLKAFVPIPATQAMRQRVLRAIEQPWDMPVTFVAAGMALLRATPQVGECIARASQAWPARSGAPELFGSQGLAALASDPLLRAMLVSMPLCAVDIERCLTLARQVLLQAAWPAASARDTEAGGTQEAGEGSALGEHGEQGKQDEALAFWCALARQCFTNEYVWSPGEAELPAAHVLRDALAAALAQGGPVPALWPVAVAAYVPLMSLPQPERLLQRAWPDEVMAVLVQQVAEPLAERRLRAAIPRATPIEDRVSLLVQHQYEENPYPRWVTTAPAGRRRRVGEEIQRLFPLSAFRPSAMFDQPELLVAGCGTGQHAILTAQRFHVARVLALDLSLASLGYARRKTGELGLSGTITYAQADLLHVGALRQRFDVIESVGVLHHMEDPWRGWRSLLSVLRPGGLMRLGFYSEAARQGVVRARARIAQQAYPATPEGVRQCRQDLIARDTGDGFGGVIATSDFYTVSACRDLLFNVQEHRMTLDGIAAFLREQALAFLGFELNPAVLAAYRKRFADDPAATDLSNWQAFENDNPDTFFGMYQFWVQRAG